MNNLFARIDMNVTLKKKKIRKKKVVGYCGEIIKGAEIASTESNPTGQGV